MDWYWEILEYPRLPVQHLHWGAAQRSPGFPVFVSVFFSVFCGVFWLGFGALRWFSAVSVSFFVGVWCCLFGWFGVFGVSQCFQSSCSVERFFRSTGLLYELIKTLSPNAPNFFSN